MHETNFLRYDARRDIEKNLRGISYYVDTCHVLACIVNGLAGKHTAISHKMSQEDEFFLA